MTLAGSLTFNPVVDWLTDAQGEKYKLQSPDELVRAMHYIQAQKKNSLDVIPKPHRMVMSRPLLLYQVLASIQDTSGKHILLLLKLQKESVSKLLFRPQANGFSFLYEVRL